MGEIMKKLPLLGFAILIIGMFVENLALAGNYTLSDVGGEYAYAFDGYIIITNAATQETQSIPTAAVGQIVFTSSNPGEFTVTAVQNLGGFAILNFASPSSEPGTFTMDSTTGIGTATAPIILTAQPDLPLGTLPPGFNQQDFASTAVYELRTVIAANGELDVIGTKLSKKDAAGQLTPIGAFVGRGIAKPQESTTTQ
jgi:hypothetical protein